MAAIDLMARTNLVGESLRSLIWNNTNATVSQDFGVAGFRPDWYAYSESLGWPAGYHVGLDVGMPKGTPILSPQYAHVEQAGWSDSFRPNPVTLVTDDNPSTTVDESGTKIILGHLWSDAVKTGDVVKPGDLLGYSGEQTVMGTMNPDGSGPHLHLEVRQAYSKGTFGEGAVNPEPWVRAIPVAGDALESGQRLVSGSGSDASPAGSGGGPDAATVANIAGRAGVYVLGVALLIVGFLAMRR